MILQKQMSPNKSASIVHYAQLGQPGGDFQVNPESFVEVTVEHTGAVEPLEALPEV
jgi:hypothetical protein